MNTKNHIERVLYIDTKIRSGGYPSKNSFAEYFEVSGKTIERDFEYMRDRLNAPLRYSAENRGYYYADNNYFLPSLVLSEEEVFALGLSIQTLKSLGNPDLSRNLERSIERIFRFLPDSVKRDLEIIGSRSVFVGPPVVKMKSEIWEPLLKAIKTNRAVNVQYGAPGYDVPVERILYPYYLLNHQDLWYILAYNKVRDRIETYAVHRIKDLKVLSESFTIPSDFKFNDYIDPLWGIFSKDEKYKVILEFEGGISARIGERNWPSDYKMFDDGEKTVLEFKTNQLESVLFWVLSLGGDAKVIEPQQLKDMVADTAGTILKKYV